MKLKILFIIFSQFHFYFHQKNFGKQHSQKFKMSSLPRPIYSRLNSDFALTLKAVVKDLIDQ